jgi:HlyD family secretion protein
MKQKIWIPLALCIAWGCSSKTEQADGYGTFEAQEVIVSAQTGGQILAFEVQEGAPVEAGAVIALIDTTMYKLQIGEIQAGMSGVKSKIITIGAQNEVLKEQIANLKVNIARVEKMLKDDAATQKQYDDLKGQVAVLQKQIAANLTQINSVNAELSVMQAKRNLVMEQSDRSWVRSPLSGMVIEKYAEAGEITAAGKPLAKIADLSVMKLKVYVSGAQLGNLKTGNVCTVRIDDGERGYRTFQGKISRVSEKAEFTPKTIQTKEERVTLVYAVTIEVPNDGTLKAGMPGEAIF